MTSGRALSIFDAVEHASKGLGIVIRSDKVRNSDRMLTLLSVPLGIVRVISYGSRKSLKAVRAPLFTEGVFSLERGQSELWTLKDIDVLSSHESLFEDLGKNMAATLFAELILTSGSSDQAVYRLFARALDGLERGDHESIAIAFIVNFLSLSGFIGDWERCPVCRREYGEDEILGFSAPEGVPACHDCDTMAMSLILPPNARRYVRRVLETGLDGELSISPMQRHRIFRYFLRLLRLSYPGRLRSLEAGVWDLEDFDESQH